jgi:hypothetical protein
MRAGALAALIPCGALAAGCYEERDRPGPPQLGITLDREQVNSPDVLTGRFRATDRDGVDSVWLVVDTVRYGIEGSLEDDVEGPFSVEVPGGKAPGDLVSLTLEARDALGFTGALDTVVRIAFPSASRAPIPRP